MTDVDERTSRARRGYFAWDRWTLIDPQEMRQRRARWPRWRRMLRPIGSTLWWGGVVLGIVFPGLDDRHHAGSAELVLSSLMAACIATCVLLGVGLEWRDRRREGRRILG